MCDAMDRIDADPDVRAVIVTGRGRGSAPAPTWAAAARRSSARRADAGRRRRSPPRRGRARDAAHLPAHQADHRRDQRPGRRRRRHDDAADGRAARVDLGTVRVRVRPRAVSCPRRARRGSSPASSGSAARWSGAPPVGCSTPTRRWRAGSFARCTSPTTSCPRRGRSPQRSRRTRRAVSVTADARAAVADARRAAPDERAPGRLGAHRRARSHAPTCARASSASSRSARRASPAVCPTTCPAPYPWWEEPAF